MIYYLFITQVLILSQLEIVFKDFDCNEVDKTVIEYLIENSKPKIDHVDYVVDPNMEYDFSPKYNYESISHRIINHENNKISEYKILFGDDFLVDNVTFSSYKMDNATENKVGSLISQEVTHFEYNRNGELTKWKNPFVSRQFEYDRKGRLVKMIENESSYYLVKYKEGEVIKFYYDKHDKSDMVLTTVYNDLEFITEIQSRHKKYSLFNSNKTYTYNKAGLITSVISDYYTGDGVFETKYEYGDCGLLERKIKYENDVIESEIVFEYFFNPKNNSVTVKSKIEASDFERDETIYFDDNSNWVKKEIKSSTGLKRSHYRTIEYLN